MSMMMMLMGAGDALDPLTGSTDSLFGFVTEPEPSPPTMPVSAAGQAGAAGGTGNYTYQWQVLTGGATIASGATAATVFIASQVVKNGSVTGTIRCTINDGQTSVSNDRAYTLTYTSL